jgi:nucleoside-diphosphate-sugar epimerase
MSEKVLVTGASGFIGSHLARRLAELGYGVRVLLREGSDRSALEGVAVEVAIGDVGEPEQLWRAAAGVSYIFNCAGMSADWGPWEQFFRTNVLGPKNLVEAAALCGGVRRILHVSTTDVYGYPKNPETANEPQDIGLPYNRSKVLGEAAVRAAAERTGLPLTIVRPVSVYGPRSKDFVIEIANLLRAGQMMYVNGGKAPAGLLYVDNAVDAMIAACLSDNTVGQAYNLRDDETTTWREYVDALAVGLGVKRPRLSLPGSVATGVAVLSELAWKALGLKTRPLLTRHAVHLFHRDQSYDIDRAILDFGFKSTVDFEEGMRRTLDWLHRQ